MDFVFDIDGTLCFDGMSLSKEIQGILEREPRLIMVIESLLLRRDLIETL